MKLSYVETIEAITIDADRVLREFAAPDWIVEFDGGNKVTISCGESQRRPIDPFIIPWTGVRRAKV